MPVALADEVRIEQPSSMLKAIAQRMGESNGPIPHFYVEAQIDMEKALALRAELNAALEGDAKVSVTDMIVRASALALLEHPAVHRSWVAEGLAYHPHANVGIAVALDDGRLSDLVNGRGRLDLHRVVVEGLRETRRLEIDGLFLALDDVCLLEILGPRGHPARRVWTVRHRVAAEVGPYTVTATIHALPGVHPLSVFRHRPAIVPLTDAVIEAMLRAVPAGQGAAYPEPSNRLPQCTRVWYLKIEDIEAAVRAYEGPTPLAWANAFRLPAAGRLVRNAYPFATFVESEGQLRLAGISRELVELESKSNATMELWMNGKLIAKAEKEKRSCKDVAGNASVLVAPLEVQSNDRNDRG